MKKLSVITFLMMGTLLFFGHISTSYADEVHSKVTATLVESDGTTNAKNTNEPGSNGEKPYLKKDFRDSKNPKSNPKKDNYSKNNLFSKLPQTGENINGVLVLLGLVLVIISLVIILIKRRRDNNEDK